MNIARPRAQPMVVAAPPSAAPKPTIAPFSSASARPSVADATPSHPNRFIAMVVHSRMLAAVVPLLALAIAPSAFAQFSISWSTIDGGGGRLSGGVYEVNASIGQPDATGGAPHAGGNFVLAGGFWPTRVRTCLADFDTSGAVTVQDIFDFLNAWFAGC